MKKIFVILTAFILGLSALVADEYQISSFKAFETAYGYEKEITLKFDDEDNVYYLFFSEYSRAYWFTFRPVELDKLREIVKKSQEWSNIAVENKSSIKKEIPNSEMRIPGTYKSGSDWYTSRNDLTLQYYFFSSMDTSTKFTSLVFMGNKVVSKQNQFIDIEFPTLAFIDAQLEELSIAISEVTVNKAKEKHNKEKTTEDLFN